VGRHAAAELRGKLSRLGRMRVSAQATAGRGRSHRDSHGRQPDSRDTTVRDETGGVRKRGLWKKLNGHVKRKRRNSQAFAYGCARRISILTGPNRLFGHKQRRSRAPRARDVLGPGLVRDRRWPAAPRPRTPELRRDGSVHGRGSPKRNEPYWGLAPSCGTPTTVDHSDNSMSRSESFIHLTPTPTSSVETVLRGRVRWNVHAQ
jgi:hypothetical protein